MSAVPRQPAAARPAAPVDALTRGADRRSLPLRRVPRLTLDALALVRRSAPRHLAATTALQVALAGLTALQLLVGRRLVTELVALDRDGGAHVADLLPTFGALIAVTVASGVVTALIAQSQKMLTELVARLTLDGIVDVASSVPLSSFEDAGFYDHLQRARAAGTYRPIDVVMSVTMFVTAALTSVGVGVALLTMEPLLVPLVLAASVPLLLAAFHNSRRAYAFEYAMTPHARERLHLLELLTGRSSAKELRVFGAVGTLRRRYDAFSDERIAKMREFLRGRLCVSLVGTVATAIGTSIALGSLVWLLATGRTPVPTAVTAALAMQVLASRLSAMTGALTKIVESGMFLEDYQSFVALVPEEPAGAAGAAGAAGIGEPFAGLEVQDVAFCYPSTERRALDGVSLEIRPGEVVALVGENGSGKTTLVKLLCRLYNAPDAGSIRWNGQDVRDLPPSAVRDRVTVLFQDFVQYELSVRDNIALGRGSDAVDEERVLDAAIQAGADEFIARLPDAYDTRLGRQFYGGHEFSGGQWQRLALARAFYRGGELLILDEPTAALDPRAEFALFERMRDLAAGTSVLLISHRFSSVRMADRIYVLDDGRIAESGTHEELVALGGLYAELYELQAAAYLGRDAAADGGRRLSGRQERLAPRPDTGRARHLRRDLR